MLDVDRRVFVLAAARAADSAANSFLIIILPIYIASAAVTLSLEGVQILGVTLQKELFIGFVLSIYGLVGSLLQPYMGGKSDSLGRRRIFVLAGIFILFISTISYQLTDNYTSILVVRIFQGLGSALSVPATVALVNEYAAGPEERGESFGVFNTGRLVGFGLGPIVAGAVYQAGPYTTPLGTISGIDAAFIIASLGALLGFLLVYAFVNDPAEIEPTADEQSIFETISLKDPAGVSRLNPVIVLGISTFLLAAAISMFTPLEGPVTERLNQSSFLFSVQFAVGVLMNVVFQVPAGKLGDKVGRRPVLIVGFILLIPSMIAQGLATTSTQMLVARASLGLSVALVFPTALALAGDIAGSRSGSTLSVLTASFGLGIAIGPLSAGFLFNIGSFSTPFFVGAATSVIALALVVVEVYEPTGDSLDRPKAD